MKKLFIAAGILCAASSSAQADTLGATVGYNYWATSGFGAFQTAYAQFEHFIPALPNAAVRFGKVDDKKLSFNSYDAYGYYELLDNDLASVDLGFGLRRFNGGKLKGQSFSGTVPMVNAEAEFLKTFPLYGYARVGLGRGSDNRFHDMEAGIRFDVLTGLSVQAGYRIYDLDMDVKSKETVRGLIAGLRLDI